MAKQDKKKDDQRKGMIREMLERAANLIPGGSAIVARKKATGVTPSESDKAKSPAGESSSGSSIDDEIRKRRERRRQALEGL